MEIQLGDRVKDRITGLTGIAVGVTDWLYECRTVTVQPDKLSKDGEKRQTIGFDEPQLELLQRHALKPLPVEPRPLRRTGGPERAIR